ncbi:hypothetical protein IFM89_025674 [Coptis chinensis]|uniref:Uncharacterized protein n=1 Tax=Coptis chinensis TaxID=261450 RepID=A0A835HMN1_9MAGN|nr:hypothetical protein IFM89_025674 [Coptis chinensis]
MFLTNRESSKIDAESLSKVAFAMLSFSVTLVKGFSGPNRRRIDSFIKNITALKCRYLGKVVDDMVAIIFDSASYM